MVKFSCSSMTSEGVGINPQVNQMRNLEGIPFPELASRTSQFPSGMSQFCQSESCFWPSPWRQNWHIPFAELLRSLARFHKINGKHPWFLKKKTQIQIFLLLLTVTLPWGCLSVIILWCCLQQINHYCVTWVISKAKHIWIG